jgi:hypothetical protein
MAPSDVTLPITPMLDMSFQLLFFFICIYKPPVSEEGQFILNLKTVETRNWTTALQGSGSGGSASSKESDDPFKDRPIDYNITLDVYTHIGTNDKGVAELLIEKVLIKGLFTPAKQTLQQRGLIKDANQEPVEVVYTPGSGEPAASTVTSQTEEAVLKKVAEILEEDKKAIPGDATTPVARIVAPRELPMHKIIRLMDDCNRFNFAQDLAAVLR